MGSQYDREVLSHRWRLLLVSGRVTEMLTEVNAVLPEAKEDDRAFFLCWHATANNHLSNYAEALGSASTALEASTSADRKTVASIHTQIGSASIGTGSHDSAISHFKMAEQMLQEIGDNWALGAVLINHAVCERSRNANPESLALLERASSYLPVSETDKEEAPHRAWAIGINRSEALFLSGRTKEAVDALLAAREVALEAQNLVSLASVDLSLAQKYEWLHLYSSALEAAESATQLFGRAENTRGVRMSQLVAASALARLGKKAQAQSLIANLLSTARAEEIDEMRAALSKVIKAFREQGFGDPYDLRKFGHEAPASEFEVIGARLRELRNLKYAGAAYAESEELISRLEALGSFAELPAQIERAVREAFFDPQSSRKLAADIQDRLDESIGPRAAYFGALLRGFAGVSADSGDEMLSAQLELLWDIVDSWHEQHDEGSRSEFLAGGNERQLRTTLDAAVEFHKPDVIMEVIETLRIDTSNAGSPRESLGLIPFSQIADVKAESSSFGHEDSKTTYPSRYLNLPRPVAVRGRSAMARAASLVQQPVDLELIRVTLAGPDALWWSCFILEQRLYWALLTPDGIQGGTKELPAVYVGALEAHLRMLPVVLESDLALLEDSEEFSAVRLIALARTAAGPMLDSQTVQDSVLAALPAVIHSSVRDYCEASRQHNLSEIYEVLAETLLPDELRQELRASRHDKRLIVTLPPELATVPMGLLPVDGDSVILDHASVQWSPPAGLAAELGARAIDGVPRPHVLAVTDTAGDLPWTAGRPSAPTTVLSGWPSAREINEVATRRNLVDQLRHGRWEGGAPGLLSYTGHLVPGDRDRPGSAALVCAPASPEEAPDLLTAHEILSWQESCFPSHVYLGGCEGTGFGTGLEWASLAAAALARGASCVLSHAWPIVDAADMAEVDRECREILITSKDVGQALRNRQRSWMDKWRRQDSDAIPPHFWAGLQLIGRAGPADQA